jgi:catechol 2,3-dioxygenase
MGVRPSRLGHLGLVVADLEGSVAFYCETLDLLESDRMPYGEDEPLTEAVFLRCNADHHVLSIFGLRNPPPRRERSGEPALGMHHMAFEFATFEALRRAARLVRERGLEVRAMRTGGPGCHVRLYVWDPEDNLIELYWGLDRVGWDGRTRPWPPFETVDIESLDIEDWVRWKGDEFRV